MLPIQHEGDIYIYIYIKKKREQERKKEQDNTTKESERVHEYIMYIGSCIRERSINQVVLEREA